MEGYDKINDCTGSITDNVPNNVPADVPNHVTENITNITKDITNATDKVTTVTENVTNPTENISHCIPVSVAGGKKPLTFDGDQSRFVKGARPQGEDDDLRPPPLRFGEKSLAEMLSEAPPEGFREPSVTSPTAKSPAARSPATQSASAGSTNTTPKSGNFKKGRLISRPSLASVRRLFSPKQKHSEAFEDSVELTGGVTSQGSPLRRKTIPVVTQQDAFGIASPTGSQLSGHDLPPPCMSPDSNVFMTAFPSTSTSSSSGMSPFEIELAAQTSFSSNKKSSATTPTHSSRGPSSSFTTSTNPSPGKIYGQPPPSMTRPIIPHRVTEEHLRLTSFPPVSKEDLAKLPKDIEPTLPSPELSPFASRHCSQPTSLKHVSSISPDREGSAGLSLTKSVGNLGAFKDDENVFNYPAQSVKRLPTLRHAYSTASIAGMPETAEQLSRYPLPRLNLKWKKEVEKYNHNSPTARTPDAVEYGDGQGHSVTVAKHAPPGSISAARRKAEMAKEALRLGISSPGFAQTPVDDQATHQSRFSPESCDSPIRTPVTPKSGNVTPSFPDFKEFYENLSKIHSNGSAKSSPRTSTKKSYGEPLVSPTLPRIQEDYVSMVESPFENPRDPPSPKHSHQTSGTATATSASYDETAPEDEPAQPEPASEVEVAQHEPVNTSSLAKITKYFSDCTPSSMRQARVSISDEPDRLKVLAKIRGLTGTQLVMRLPGRPKHPNHERAFYAKNLWCMHHTHSCSVCNAACCVLTEAVEAYDEATNHYDKAIAKEAGDVIQACVYPLDSTTFLECAECDRFVCPDCIGICPDNDCKLHFCKECKLDPWGPCSWHNLI